MHQSAYLGVHNLAELSKSVLQIVVIELPGKVADVQPVGIVEPVAAGSAGALAALARGSSLALGQHLVHAHGTAIDLLFVQTRFGSRHSK
eukprot:1193272-Prorocentrum_minimum.AAC.3